MILQAKIRSSFFGELARQTGSYFFTLLANHSSATRAKLSPAISPHNIYVMGCTARYVYTSVFYQYQLLYCEVDR